MNSLELKNILSRALPRKVTFLGVFASDQIPNTIQVTRQAPCCYVANTDPISRQGSHWVAVYIPSPRTLEFFDSFGRHPITLGFSFPNSIRILHNTIQIQADSSGVCGEHCVRFLSHRSNGKSMSHILSMLKNLPHFTSDFHASKFNSSIMSKNQ